MFETPNLEQPVIPSKIQVASAVPVHRIDPSTLSVPASSEGGKGGERGTLPLSTLPSAPLSPPLRASMPRDVGRPEVRLDGDNVYTPAPVENPVLAALKQTGLYVQALGGAQHSITCPWSHEHGESSEFAATYGEPDGTLPSGEFRCHHPHGGQLHVGQLLDFLGVSIEAARCKPVIRQVAGEMNRIVAAAELALVAAGGFYQAGGAILSIRTDAISGDVTTEVVSEQALTKALSAATDWMKFDGRSSKWVRCDPPVRIVQLLLRGQGFEHLPLLSGLARQPYIRRSDGVLVDVPGYDPVSKIYAAFDPGDFPMPEPTEEAAREAVAELNALLDEFHFDSPTDRSAALCGMLTASVRSSLPFAPAFNITASGSGSGKSYLAATIAPLAGPGDPLNVSYPTTAEEATKAMSSVLVGKPAVVLFDDMQTDWLPHGVMNRMLTSETITDRVLGVSRTMTVSTSSLFMGTGNNVGPVRDMCRRVITVYLSPKTASPATLSYAGRPAEAVRKSRGRYVAAALTIIRAWEQAGRPRADVPSIATFDDGWGSLCRHPLIWLGQPDPATSLIAQLQSDPDAEALGDLMWAWRKCFGHRPTTVRRVVEASHQMNDLKEALADLPVHDRGLVNPAKLGWFLKKRANQIVNGMQVRKSPTGERNAWSVVDVGGVVPMAPRRNSSDEF